MLDWINQNEILAISVVISALALALSAHAELRMRNIQSLSFPRVTAVWSGYYRHYDVIVDQERQSPPCPVPVASVYVDFPIRENHREFEIVSFKLRWRDYGLWPIDNAFFETFGYPP